MTQRGSILIVDDNADILKILATKLTAVGYQVDTAKDAVTGVIKAKSDLPGLILLDIMMPVTDGFEALQRLKSIDLTRDIPVIMLTARRAKEDVLRSLQLGAHDYIVKPVDFQRLMQKIEQNIRLTPGGASPAAAGAASPAGGPARELVSLEQLSQELAHMEAAAPEAPALGGFKIEVVDEGGVRILRLSGELNAAAASQVIAQLDTWPQTAERRLLLDISGLQRFFWFKTESLLRLLEWLERHQVTFRLACADPKVYIALTKSRLRHEVARDAVQALEQLRS